jgi:hypothetical protein
MDNHISWEQLKQKTQKYTVRSGRCIVCEGYSMFLDKNDVCPGCPNYKDPDTERINYARNDVV